MQIDSKTKEEIGLALVDALELDAYWHDLRFEVMFDWPGRDAYKIMLSGGISDILRTVEVHYMIYQQEIYGTGGSSRFGDDWQLVTEKISTVGMTADEIADAMYRLAGEVRASGVRSRTEGE